MSKIKLMISSVDLNYGGIEKSLLNLLNNLDNDIFSITLCLESISGVYLPKLNKDIKVIEYKPSKYKIINFFKRIFFSIKHQNKYDVSICYATYSFPANFVARTSSKKRIIFIHSNYYEAFNHDINKFKSFYDLRYLSSYNNIICVSNNIKDDFINIYPEYKENALVVNNIVNTEEIIEGSKESININNKYKYTGCFIGRLEEDSKRLSILAKLAKKCKKEDIGFLIIGSGKDKKILENIDNITLIGASSNPYKYLSKCDFLILTSRYEGYPVVYSEAITLGKPILTTLDIIDDEIDIKEGYGIVSNDKDLYNNLLKITKYKSKKIDFNKVNEKRITKINKVIKELYEKN